MSLIVKNNLVRRRSETRKETIENKNDLPLIEMDEPLIAIDMNKSVEGDPLLIEETVDLSNRAVVLNRNDGSRVRTYSRKRSNVQKEIKVDPELTLKSMILDVLKDWRSLKGYGSRAIRQFINIKYGVDFQTDQIVKELKKGVESGELYQIRRVCSKELLGRYILSKLKLGNSLLKERKEHSKFAKLDTSFNTKEENVITDLQDIDESGFHDNGTKTSEEDNKEVKIDISLEENIPNLESRDQKLDGDDIHGNEIDFMVSHALSSPSNPNGMNLDEIAEFIHKFYNIDKNKWFPSIERYLNYSIDKGILFKNGDKYKKTFATWNLNSEMGSEKQMKSNGDNNLPIMGKNKSNISQENVCFFSSNVKSEPEEIDDDTSKSEIVSNYEKMEISKKRKKAQVLEKKRPREETKLSFSKKVSTPKTARNKLSENNVKQKKTIEQFDDTLEQESDYEELEEESDYEELEEESDYEEETSDDSSDSSTLETELSNVGNKRNKKLKTELIQKNSFPSLERYLLSKQELETPKRRYHLRIKPRPSYVPDETSLEISDEDNKIKYGGKYDFDVRYTLDEIKEYISQYPETLADNSSELMRNLSWESFPLTNEISCLKLTASNISDDDNFNCKICDSELRFGSFNCDVCSSEVESNALRCNICNLICNHGDVFHKHLLWEHMPLIKKKRNYVPLSIPQENVEKLIKKQANEMQYYCELCQYSIHVKKFKAHVLSMHTTAMNAFPQLPEEKIPGQFVILQNEITNALCHKCDECSFISNRNLFMTYHTLDCHGPIENDLYSGRPVDTIIDLRELDINRQKDKLKWSYGLCYFCGKFYNNLSKHMERRHQLIIYATQSEIIYGKKPVQRETEYDPMIDELPLSDRLSERNKKIERSNIQRPKKRKRKTYGPYLCHVCGKVLKTKLWGHMRIHYNEIHDCNICGKKFNRQSNLLTHMRVHTREKPFQCDICKMMFGYKCSIKGHIENVHSETVK